MRKFPIKIWIVAVIMLLMLAMVIPATANGDKVRGDRGQGSVYQVQVQDPPPFQP